MLTLLREMGPVLIAVIVIGPQRLSCRRGDRHDEGVRGNRGALRSWRLIQCNFWWYLVSLR